MVAKRPSETTLEKLCRLYAGNRLSEIDISLLRHIYELGESRNKITNTADQPALINVHVRLMMELQARREKGFRHPYLLKANEARAKLADEEIAEFLPKKRLTKSAIALDPFLSEFGLVGSLEPAERETALSKAIALRIVPGLSRNLLKQRLVEPWQYVRKGRRTRLSRIPINSRPTLRTQYLIDARKIPHVGKFLREIDAIPRVVFEKEKWREEEH
ncbi:MAG: hypothetical protein ABH863_00265 [Candidatus Micrarchaeota archaeon]